jgi:hypothetical protein
LESHLVRMMAVCHSISMFSARFCGRWADRLPERSRGTSRWLAAIALAALISPLCGCSDGGSGGTGAGTVDVSRAKEAASTNPDLAKAAAARGAGGIGDAQKGAKSAGRK